MHMKLLWMGIFFAGISHAAQKDLGLDKIFVGSFSKLTEEQVSLHNYSIINKKNALRVQEKGQKAFVISMVWWWKQF